MQGFFHYSAKFYYFHNIDESMKLRVKFYYLGFLFCFVLSFVDPKEILTYDFRPWKLEPNGFLKRIFPLLLNICNLIKSLRAAFCIKYSANIQPGPTAFLYQHIKFVWYLSIKY